MGILWCFTRVGSLYCLLIHPLPPPNGFSCTLQMKIICPNILHSLWLKIKCDKNEKQLRKSAAEKVKHTMRENRKETQNSGGGGRHNAKAVRSVDWRVQV